MSRFTGRKAIWFWGIASRDGARGSSRLGPRNSFGSATLLPRTSSKNASLIGVAEVKLFLFAFLLDVVPVDHSLLFAVGARAAA